VLRKHSPATDVTEPIGKSTSFTETRLRRVALLSVVIGLLAGLGEGAIDLTVRHFHTPEILYLAVIVNGAVFLIVGVIFWALSVGLESRTASLLVFAVLFFFVLHGWQLEATARIGRRDLRWLVTVLVIALFAGAFSAWLSPYEKQLASALSHFWPVIVTLIFVCILGFFAPRMKFWSQPDRVGPGYAQHPPNVLLIIVDTLRADHLSSYGYKRPITPNIDYLATHGMAFDNAISTSSWTLPSHASMFTGLYPTSHGAQTLEGEIGSKTDTVAQELSRSGYQTAAFSASPYFTRRQNFGGGFQTFQDFFFSPGESLSNVHYSYSIMDELGGHGVMSGPYWAKAAVVNASVSRWAAHASQPYFLTLNYFEVHEPEIVPETWPRRFGRGEFLKSSPQNPSAEQVQQKIDDYDDAVAFVDERIGELLDGLQQRKLLDNTLVIFTSDHGEGLGDNGDLSHGTNLHYSAIHVPLIFYWPGRIRSGFRVSQPVSTRDLAATILELTSANGDLPGNSLASFWQTDSPAHWPMPISQLLRDRTARSRSFDRRDEIESVISPEFHLIEDPRNGPSLYDWRKDPEESSDLSHLPDYQVVLESLLAQIRDLD
jgi:arylsulfatase A-like enzyme